MLSPEDGTAAYFRAALRARYDWRRRWPRGFCFVAPRATSVSSSGLDLQAW